MSLTRDLLRLPPWEAIIEMINRRYHMSIDPQSAQLVELDPLDDDRMEITLALKPSNTLRNLLPPTQQMTVIYRRLDLNRFFGGPLTLPPDSTIVSTLDLTHYLTQRTGVVFDKDDVIHEMIPVGVSPYILKAHPRSIRWVGELTINLN